MKLKGALTRLLPLQAKLRGHLPLCPWKTVLTPLSPHTLGGYPPPPEMKIVAVNGAYNKIRFADKHDFWFPAPTEPTPQLWSEYLTAVWDHPSNGHYYFACNTKVRAGDVCIDCGACEGFFARQALEIGAAKVVCIEPSAQMTRSLRRTFESEVASGHLTIEEAGLSAVCGSAAFDFDSNRPFGGAFSATSTGDAPSVAITTLDRLMDVRAFTHIDFIKMDLEGAELQAVQGGLALLRRFHPRLAITTYHRAFDYAALRSLLIGAGYHKIHPTGIACGDEGPVAFRPVMLHAWV